MTSLHPSIAGHPKIREHAFTLIELLVVVAIIGILAALLLPIISSIRESTWQAGCGFRMNKCATAGLIFASENKNRLPSLNIAPADYNAEPLAAGIETDPAKRIITNSSYFWQEMIRPYLENNNAFNCPRLTLPALGCPGGGGSPVEQLGIAINITAVAPNSSGKWTTKAKIPSPSQVVWFMDAAGQGFNDDATDSDWNKRPDFPGAGATFFRGSASSFQTNVTPRHRKKANACFVDGHVALVVQNQITKSYDPSNSTAVGYTDF